MIHVFPFLLPVPLSNPICFRLSPTIPEVVLHPFRVFIVFFQYLESLSSTSTALISMTIISLLRTSSSSLVLGSCSHLLMFLSVQETLLLHVFSKSFVFFVINFLLRPLRLRSSDSLVGSYTFSTFATLKSLYSCLSLPSASVLQQLPFFVISTACTSSATDFGVPTFNHPPKITSLASISKMFF